MKCPHCNNEKNNHVLNYCTICETPHQDVLCGECGKRFSHEIKITKESVPSIEIAAP
jgi:transcription elongation factor Elf1